MLCFHFFTHAFGLPTAGQTTADYDIGDSIPYVLTFTLPNKYAEYEKYPITFTDDMCAGLTYNGDAKIYYGENDTTGTPITFTQDTNATSSYTNGKVYKYTINDLKTSKSDFTSGTITIKYTATLNSSAVVGSTGNPNKYSVTFANDPTWRDNPTTPTNNPPTGETPPVTNTVFTYKVVINKVKSDNSALTGADFELYKFIKGTGGAEDTWTIVTGLHTGNGEINPSKTGDTTGSTFTFSGLDDGHYKLVETATPNGYNTIEPIIFTIAPTADGDLENITLNNETFLTANDTAGSLTGNVINQAGVVLPSTGGIGTTIFYIVGGSLIVGAVILLITKKRMSISDKK